MSDALVAGIVVVPLAWYGVGHRTADAQRAVHRLRLGL